MTPTKDDSIDERGIDVVTEDMKKKDERGEGEGEEEGQGGEQEIDPDLLGALMLYDYFDGKVKTAPMKDYERTSFYVFFIAILVFSLAGVLGATAFKLSRLQEHIDNIETYTNVIEMEIGILKAGYLSTANSNFADAGSCYRKGGVISDKNDQCFFVLRNFENQDYMGSELVCEEQDAALAFATNEEDLFILADLFVGVTDWDGGTIWTFLNFNKVKTDTFENGNFTLGKNSDLWDTGYNKDGDRVCLWYRKGVSTSPKLRQCDSVEIMTHIICQNNL